MNPAARRPRWLATLAALALAAAPAHPDEVDDYVESERVRQHIPGLVVAVVRDGAIERVKGYGLANVELGVAVRPETIFQSGSIGKQFTAAAILLLAEDGKLGLDDPISKHLEGTPESWSGVTIRHLLTQTSGVGDVYDRLDLRVDQTTDELLAEAIEVPVAFAPGAKWEYSNTGYMLLGFTIEEVSGQYYHEFLAERVYGPAGMTTARAISEEDIVHDRAAGYRLVGDQLKNQEWVAPKLNTTADGSTYFSAIDLAHWSLALDGEDLLQRSSLDLMWTPATLGDGTTHPYGFAWFLEDEQGHRCFQHGGAWQGFTTYIARYPDDGLTVIALANRAGCDPGRITKGVACRLVHELGEASPDVD